MQGISIYPAKTPSILPTTDKYSTNKEIEINKEQIEEIALNEAQKVSVRYGGNASQNYAAGLRDFFIDFTHTLLTKLAKVQEPVGFLIPRAASTLPYYVPVERTCRNAADLYGWQAIYTIPLPQPDLVAEIDRLRARLEISKDTNWDGIAYRNETIGLQDLEINNLRHQLSEAKSGEEALLKALDAMCGDTTSHYDRLEITRKAIAYHKSLRG